jgi:hypothetical protein
MKDCIGEHPRALTVQEWNDERKHHHDLYNIFFKGQLDLLCDSCRAPVILQEHYWFSDYPYRQAICTNRKSCGKSTYVMA